MHEGRARTIIVTIFAMFVLGRRESRSETLWIARCGLLDLHYPVGRRHWLTLYRVRLLHRDEGGSVDYNRRGDDHRPARVSSAPAGSGGVDYGRHSRPRKNGAPSDETTTAHQTRTGMALKRPPRCASQGGPLPIQTHARGGADQVAPTHPRLPPCGGAGPRRRLPRPSSVPVRSPRADFVSAAMGAAPGALGRSGMIV